MIDLGVLSLVIVYMVMLWSVMMLSYVGVFAYVVFDQRKENKALRKELERYTQPPPPEPEWVKYLFSDQPSDPRIGALN